MEAGNLFEFKNPEKNPEQPNSNKPFSDESLEKNVFVENQEEMIERDTVLESIKDVETGKVSGFGDDSEKSQISHLEKAENEKPTETTREQQIEKQDKAINEVDCGNKRLETTQEKGNYGEMKTDQDLRKKGYERISKDVVTSLDNETHQGIDGVYYNKNGKPKYIIADAKYGKAQLSETQDGKQMSESWIDNRLDQSVGKERADEIRLEKVLNPDNVGSYVSHIDGDGNVTYDKLDENGNVIEKDVNINA